MHLMHRYRHLRRMGLNTASSVSQERVLGIDTFLLPNEVFTIWEHPIDVQPMLRYLVPKLGTKLRS